MHLIEIRQDIHDTSVEENIHYISQISNQLMQFVELTEDLSYTDFAYITALLSKTKTLLCEAYTIFDISSKGV